MPQPLTRTPSKLNFSGGALTKYPDLVVMVMEVIDYWSLADHSLYNLVSACLKSDVEMVTTMFQQIYNPDIQRAAVSAAVETILKDTDLGIFRAVLATTKASRTRRNEFAHHLWGIAENVDGLLLLDPKYFASWKASRAGPFKRGVFGDDDPDRPHCVA